MRKLKVSRRPADPAREAAYALALPLLRQLAAARPLGVDTAYEEH